IENASDHQRIVWMAGIEGIASIVDYIADLAEHDSVSDAVAETAETLFAMIAARKQLDPDDHRRVTQSMMRLLEKPGCRKVELVDHFHSMLSHHCSLETATPRLCLIYRLYFEMIGQLKSADKIRERITQRQKSELVVWGTLAALPSTQD